MTQTYINTNSKQMNKTIHRVLMTIVFIMLLPFLVVEILIKNPNEVIARVKLSYQLMLFVVNLGSQNKQRKS